MNLETIVRPFERWLSQKESDLNQKLFSWLANGSPQVAQEEAKKVFEKMGQYTTKALDAILEEIAIEARDTNYKKSLKAGFQQGAFRTQTPSPATTQIIRDTQLRMVAKLDSAQNRVRALLRDTQQKILTEPEINSAIMKGMNKSGTPQGIKGEIQKAMLLKVSGGKVSKWSESLPDRVKFIQAGSKNYKISVYSELLARTRASEVNARQTMDTLKEFRVTAVKISDHNTKSEICKEYEGKIFSIDPSDTRFPFLDKLWPWHPNCKHTGTAYVF